MLTWVDLRTSGGRAVAVTDGNFSKRFGAGSYAILVWKLGYYSLENRKTACLEAGDKWSPHPGSATWDLSCLTSSSMTRRRGQGVLLSSLQLTSEQGMQLMWQSACSKKARDHCACFIQWCATEGQMWHEKFSHGKWKNIHRKSKTGLPGRGTSHGSRLSPLNSTQSQSKNSLFQVPIKKAWKEEKLFGARRCLKQLRIRNLMTCLDVFRNIFLCFQKANVQIQMPEDQPKTSQSVTLPGAAASSQHNYVFSYFISSLV